MLNTSQEQPVPEDAFTAEAVEGEEAIPTQVLCHLRVRTHHTMREVEVHTFRHVAKDEILHTPQKQNSAVTATRDIYLASIQHMEKKNTRCYT